MPRLYILAVGGTGSRVLKSLTMLLASGLIPNADKTYEIVPVIIDPHKSNEDLKRTIRLLDNYQSITREIGNGRGFFGTSILTLDKLSNSQNRLTGNFTFNLQQVANTKYKEYIGFNQLDEANKALAEILFSGKSINKRGEQVDLLDIEMDIGFVGNPNIGSVVLNQFKDSEEFNVLSSNFDAEDRIFVISSIFGGTGAAGFPSIVKNIRNAKKGNEGFLRNAKIGAISVLPYFNIEQDDDSPIKRSDFISKTKAALHYYKDNVTGNNTINTMYYIADDYIGKPYQNDPGDNGQKNDAHFIELASALAIIDFMEIPDHDLETIDGKAVKPIYREFAIRKDTATIEFEDLADYTEKVLSLSLSKLAIFKKYINENLNESVEMKSWSNEEPAINRKFMDSPFYRTNLTEFLESFQEWLHEMSGNNRSFSPFNLASSLDAMIVGKTIKKGFFDSKVDYHTFNDMLNKISQRYISKGKTYPNAAAKFIKLFNDTSEELLISKFGIQNKETKS
jgi:hypothetical protein